MIVAVQPLNSTFVSFLLWTRDLFRLLKTLSNSQRPQLKLPIKFVQKTFLSDCNYRADISECISVMLFQ